ncbi:MULTISPECIES: 2,3-diaminopropionate biosynthesis protein SbnA [Streptomyces]|uniref:2,3-diaminopropionate biosynthesis protein SbnA n=1 Tax=Streptomyces solicathayae TaxID=3081768 RepID=A0ABZ0M2V7_9ACTN|nr:2,3-diaminopropionate biosynthesis protein SbnA [Streptomyces sp. HUAS YS2]WOX25998.1 2,3-diaminopropionate biosynthesis protein SbnA [Streptomyces sp. HUAS YS2]
MILDHVYDIVTDDIFLRLDGMVPGGEVFLKLEGLNPAGSIKLKTAVGMVEDAERSGLLTAGGRIIESSSGSLGVALALVSVGKGLSFTCVTDPNASRHSVRLMRALGVDVVEVDRRDANGGYLGTRIDYIRQRLQRDPGLVWLNQYANPANVRTHAVRTASAILREIGRVDYLFVGAGTTGTMMGCATHFRRHSPQTRIIAVDSQGSVTFGHSPGPRYIPGLGTSRVPEICRPDAVDEIVMVAEEEAVRTCRELARRRGLMVGGSTGSVMSALSRMAPDIPEGSRIVAISPDLGDRYVQTIYNDSWVASTFGSDADLTEAFMAISGETGH